MMRRQRVVVEVQLDTGVSTGERLEPGRPPDTSSQPPRHLDQPAHGSRDGDRSTRNHVQARALNKEEHQLNDDTFGIKPLSQGAVASSAGAISRNSDNKKQIIANGGKKRIKAYRSVGVDSVLMKKYKVSKGKKARTYDSRSLSLKRRTRVLESSVNAETQSGGNTGVNIERCGRDSMRIQPRNKRTVTERIRTPENTDNGTSSNDRIPNFTEVRSSVKPIQLGTMTHPSSDFVGNSSALGWRRYYGRAKTISRARISRRGPFLIM